MCAVKVDWSLRLVGVWSGSPWLVDVDVDVVIANIVAVFPYSSTKVSPKLTKSYSSQANLDWNPTTCSLIAL